MKITLLILFIIFSLGLNGQVAIGIATPHNSAMLDVTSTSKGFLPPGMTSSQRDSITSPAAGLIVWCKNCGSFGEINVFNGRTWTNSIGDSAGITTPILKVGQLYQGGIIFYIDGTGRHGLIAAPKDQSIGIPWFNNGVYVSSGATETAVGTGLSNTNAIIIAQGSGDYAASICDTLRIGGYTDWFLPSKDELNLMWINIGDGATGANQYNNIGGFMGGNSYYWSSSEENLADVWTQIEGNGGQIAVDKLYANPVRAIRSF